MALVADSVAEFSSVQGQNNWQYLRATPSNATNPLLTGVTPLTWSGTDWVGPASFSTPLINANGGHPSDNNQWPVRRWTSEVTGLVTLSGTFQHLQTGGGDGTYGRLYVGDREAFALAAPQNPAVPGTIFNFSTTIYVVAGENIDLAIDDRGNFNFDMTEFKLQVNTVTSRGVIADSFRDFSGVQGGADFSQTGTWSYGHYATTGNPATFTTAGWTFGTEWTRPAGSFHILGKSGGHPDATLSSVRRWTSGVSGNITLDGVVRRTNEDPGQNTGNSDGMVARLFQNGTQILNVSLNSFLNLNGVNDLINGNSSHFSLPITVAAGDTIDLVIEPDGPGGANNNFFDGFDFYTTISSADRIVQGTNGDDVFVLSVSGGATQYTLNGGTPIDITGSNSITFNGLNGNDTLIVDHSGGNPNLPGGVRFNGGTQTGIPGDKIVLQGGSATTTNYKFTSANDGSITIDGRVITYTGLEPIADNMSAANRIFNYTGGAETITLTDTGGADNMTTISSTLGESVTFLNPTSSTTIDVNTGAAAGADTINFASVDSGFIAATTITAGGDDVVNFNAALNLTAGGGALAANIGAINVATVTLATSGNQTYNGTLTLTGSTLNANAASVVLGGDVTTIASGTQATISGSGGLNLGGLTRTFNVAQGAANEDLRINAGVTNGGVIKNGTGFLTLAGAGSYTGGTQINGGTVMIQNAAGFGTNTVNVGAGTNVLLWFNTGSNTVNNSFILNGIATQAEVGGAKPTIYADGAGGGFNEFILAGQITLNGAGINSNIGGNSVNNIRITGQITGAGGLIKGGSRTDEVSTLTLTNSANNYGGPTLVQQGHLRLGANEVIPNGSAVTVNADRSLNLSSFNETFASLAGDGTVIRSTGFTGDADVGISNAKTYTHALDFAADSNGVGTVAVVNGVTFTNAGVTGANYTTNLPGGAPSTNNGATGATGGISQLLTDFYYNTNPLTITLNGLTAGTTYELRLYNRTWGGPRSQIATFDHDGAGPGGTRMVFDQDAPSNPSYLSYRYTAVSSLPLVITISATTGATYHLYGLTNEVVTSSAVTPTLTVGSAANTTFNGTISGPGNLIKQGTGTLTFAGPTGNAYFGTTTVNEGTLNLNKGNAISILGPLVIGDADANVETVNVVVADQIADTSAVTVNSNGLLNLGGNETIASLAGNGQVSYQATQYALSTVSFKSDADVGISTSKTYTHLLDWAAGNAGPVGAAVVNGVAFTDAGPTGPNWTTNLGAPPATNDANTGATGGIHELLRDFYYNVPNLSYTLTGLTPGTTYDLRIYNRTWTAPFNRSQTAVFDPDGAGPLSHSISFNEDDAGINPSYINYRYVAVTTSVTVNITQTGGGTYHNYGLSNEVVPVSPPTLTTGDATSTTFSGAMSGNGNLVKRGTGTFALGGNNSYTGTTNVQAGILRVNGNNTGTGAVTVQSGATLGGDGSIAGPVTVLSGGTLAPGNSPGDLATGNLVLSSGSNYNVEIAGVAPGAGYDQTVVTGTVDVTGANLNVTSSIVPPTGAVFVLIKNDGTDAVTGFFANAPSEGATIVVGGDTYVVSYIYNAEAGTFGDGNDVALITNQFPVAVPGSYTISEGDDLQLDASGSSDADGDTLTYRWDVDGDGDFDENITGENPLVTWAMLQALGVNDGLNPAVPRTIHLEADDGFGGVTVSTETDNFIINNTAPTAIISGPTVTGPGQSVSFTFSASDSSDADMAANFTYDIDWDNDAVVDETIVGPASGVTVSHTYAALGSYTISVTATDKDGGVSAPATQNIDVVPVYQDGAGNIIAVGLDSTDDRFIFSLASGGKIQVRWENAASAPGGPYPMNYGPFTLGSEGRLIAFGNGGADTITTSVPGVPVSFDGGAGNDYLAGGNVNDSLIGGDGDDRILGGIGNDFIDCGIGNDSVDGGADNDTILGGAGIDTLNGSAGNDVMDGGDDKDNMNGGAGMDIMFGGGGGDTVNGAADGDVLVGGDGDDSLLGDTGRDILLGGYGKDTLTGGNDDDVLAGGFTSYDNYSPTNAAALQALLAEWGGANPYATRVANLKSGGGVTGGNRLNPGAALGGTVTVVNDDGFNDTLTGGAGTTGGVDWFLASTATSGANKDTTDRVLSGTGAETLN